jgi:hypothetical protein
MMVVVVAGEDVDRRLMHVGLQVQNQANPF